MNIYSTVDSSVSSSRKWFRKCLTGSATMQLGSLPGMQALMEQTKKEIQHTPSHFEDHEVIFDLHTSLQWRLEQTDSPLYLLKAHLLPVGSFGPCNLLLFSFCQEEWSATCLVLMLPFQCIQLSGCYLSHFCQIGRLLPNPLSCLTRGEPCKT